MADNGRAWRDRVERGKWPAVLLALSLTAIQPFLSGRWPWRGDGLLHFYRLLELDRAVAQGVWYPRWLPDLGFGFGFPLFNYYAPLSYYLMLPGRWVGFSAESTLLLAYALALLSTAAGIAGWLRALLPQRPAAALLAAVSALYAPYLLYNVHHRGALAEAWGLAWLSLSLWALAAYLRRGGRWELAAAGLSVAALCLTHNITALVGVPLLGVYGLAAGWTPPDGSRARAWGRACLPLALGLGVSAFFWLPALGEQNLVQIHQLYAPADFDFRHNFTSLATLLHRPVTADPQLVNPPIPLSYSWPVLFLAAAAWRPGHTSARGLRLGLTLVVVGLTWLMLPVSQPVWEQIDLLKFVQFPWRLLGPASLALAALAGLGVADWPWSPARTLPLLYVGVAGYALFWLFPARLATPPEPSPLGLLRFEAQTGALGTTSAGDYLPVGVRQLPAPDALWSAYAAAAPDYLIERLDRAALPPTVHAQEVMRGLLRGEWQVNSPAGFTARFLWYFFPGWQVWVDGAPVTTQVDGEMGRVSAEISPGPHTLRLDFSDTPLRQWATRLSLAGLLGLALAVWATSPQVAPRRGGASLALWPVAATALAVCLFKTVGLDHADTFWQRNAFDGQAVRGVAQPASVNFDARLLLLGYDLPQTSLPADAVLDVALYWQALPPISADYRVALHLLDADGRRYGQSDHLHPAGYPVSRWQPEEYARDAHRLTLDVGIPPGPYSLVLLVDAPDGRRLPILGESGLPSGATYTLATIQVTPPRRPSNPAAVQPRLALDLSQAGWRLLGVDPPSTTTFAVGQSIPVTFYWWADAPPPRDYLAQLALTSLDAPDVIVARSVFAPGRVGWPTSTWPAGTLVKDLRVFLIPPAQEDGAALATGRYRLLTRLTATDGSGQTPDAVLTVLDITAPPRSLTPPAELTLINPASSDAAAVLYGFRLDGEPRPGGQLALTLVWQSRQVTSISYTVFIHILDAQDRIVAQVDRLPAAGARPTTSWLPPEWVTDGYTLTLPPTPGVYRVAVGLYEASTGARLGERLVLPVRLEVRGE